MATGARQHDGSDRTAARHLVDDRRELAPKCRDHRVTFLGAVHPDVTDLVAHINIETLVAHYRTPFFRFSRTVAPPLDRLKARRLAPRF